MLVMPKKSCQYCGIVDMKHVCPVVQKEQRIRDSKREDKKIYWSSKWRKLREASLGRTGVYLLIIYVCRGYYKSASVCHHIVEIIVDDTKSYDKDNVIGLSKDTHDKVHELYKIDNFETMRVLLECNRFWSEGVRLEGLGMLRDRASKIELNNSI